MENRKVKQVLSEDWHHGRGGYKERCGRVNVVELCVLMYENGKVRPVETVPEWQRGDKGE
jgi:hypothetical protein